MADAPILGGDARRSSSTTPPSARASTARSCTRRCAPSWPRAAAAPHRPRRAARSPAAAPSRGARRAPAAPAPARSRSPIWTGGGIVFGPQPRHYTFKVNRKERRAALRSALSRARRARLARDPRRRRRSTRRRPSRPPSCSPSWAERRLGARRARRRARSASRCRSATSTRVVRAARRRASASPTSIGAARLLVSEDALDALTARANGDRRGGRRRPTDGAHPGHHPPGRHREELRARRRRQATRSASTPTRTRRRSARRSRSSSTSTSSRSARCRVKSKPKRRGYTSGRTRAVEEGDRPGARGRHDPDLPGPAGPRGLS